MGPGPEPKTGGPSSKELGSGMNKLIARAGIPLIGVALLAGCSATGGTAAVVNGVSIPDSRVTGFAEGCSTVLQGTPQLAQSANELRPQMVKWAVLDEMSRQQAAESDEAPTEDQLREYVERAGLGVLLSDERCEQATLGVARHDLIALGLGEDMASYFGAFDIELNPRYGEWNATDLQAGGSGSLSSLPS